MFCPNCRTEYKEGITVCADCGAPLVEELPPESKPEWADLVTVLSTVNASTIALAKSILEDAGMDFSVKGELPKAMLSIGIMQIQVSSDDEAEARKLLEGVEEE
jgi:hypothetical protein